MRNIYYYRIYNASKRRNACIEYAYAGSCGIASIAEPLKTKHRRRFGISVKQTYWSLGVGSLFVREILFSAKKSEIEQVELGVYSDNLRGQKLYERCGFLEWGRVLNAYKLKDGSYRDEVNMVLPLNDDMLIER